MITGGIGYPAKWDDLFFVTVFFSDPRGPVAPHQWEERQAARLWV